MVVPGIDGQRRVPFPPPQPPMAGAAPLFRVLDLDGAVVAPEHVPQLSDEECRALLRNMLRSNTMDSVMYDAQRQVPWFGAGVEVSFFLTPPGGCLNRGCPRVSGNSEVSRSVLPCVAGGGTLRWVPTARPSYFHQQCSQPNFHTCQKGWVDGSFWGGPSDHLGISGKILGIVAKILGAKHRKGKLIFGGGVSQVPPPWVGLDPFGRFGSKGQGWVWGPLLLQPVHPLS